MEIYGLVTLKNYDKPTEISPETTAIKEKLCKWERVIKDYQNPLDFPITQQELRKKLLALKGRKAFGSDGILNEFLKHCSEKCQLAILKLFNRILCTGHFPEIWNKGIITPIYKNGDKFDPQNYRGICVNSNLGKLFCSILNSRIVDFLTVHEVLNQSQIGFMPNFRTTDHIRTLTTLIDTKVHQNKDKVYACFVDFQKAFDSIWYEGLLYKILECGIGGKTYDCIKSMYSNNECAVKIGHRRTEYFTQKQGVRQGCSLSPTLFNI